MDHDGVAVVLQGDRAGDVVELDGLESLVQVGAANVDGRLLVALGAGLVSRVELAPDQRAASCPGSPRGRWFARRPWRPSQEQERQVQEDASSISSE